MYMWPWTWTDVPQSGALDDLVQDGGGIKVLRSVLQLASGLEDQQTRWPLSSSQQHASRPTLCPCCLCCAVQCRALVCAQRAINAAVESGANPRVTEAAANYGNYQAYRATQYTPCGQWRQGMNWSGTNCGKK